MKTFTSFILRPFPVVKPRGLMHAVLWVGLSLGANAWAQSPISAQERLDAIRESLVEASLKTPTQVFSTVWVDSRGGLHEFSSFRNQLQVQSVNVLGFERDAQGLARAQLRLQGIASSEAPDQRSAGSGLTKDTDSRAGQHEGCKVQTADATLRHVVSFALQMDPGTHSVLEQLMPLLLREQWLQPTSQPRDQVWRWVPDLSRPLLAREASAYERGLVGRFPEDLPWHANLRVSTRTLEIPAIGAWQVSEPDTVEVVLSFTLRAADQRAAPHQMNARLVLGLDMQQWKRPTLKADSLAALQQQLQEWRSQLHQLLRCEAVRPKVTLATTSRIKINAGSLAGVQEGDEWLIADPSSFPSRLVSRDGATVTLLAKVDSVQKHEAVLTVLAGPSEAVRTNWRAWPVQSILKDAVAARGRSLQSY